MNLVACRQCVFVPLINVIAIMNFVITPSLLEFGIL